MPSMLRKKSKDSYKHFPIYRYGLIGTFFGFILLFLFQNFPYYVFLPHHSLAEIKKNDFKEIPQEVKAKHLKTAVKNSYHIPILMYHYVEYPKDIRDTMRLSLNTYPNIFEKQVKTLKDNGFTFITMKEVADIIDGKRSLPPKPVVLTFDDGYRDFYEVAFPILKKHSVKAVVYVVPGLLDRPNYMLKWQVKILGDSPLIELGAHTMHHVYLKDARVDIAKKEIIVSKYALEDLIHKPVVSFAYPYGAFDNNAIDLVKNANFRTSVSTIEGATSSQANRFFIFRLRPGQMTGPVLTTYIGSPLLQ